MSELDIARLLNDKVVDFGNERFLEGWNGATEHIIKLLETLKEWESPIPIRETHADSIIELIKGEF